MATLPGTESLIPPGTGGQNSSNTTLGKTDNEKHDAETPETEDKNTADHEFPDGGSRAWIVAFGTACANVAAFGFVIAWGVFQGYYETNTLRSSSSSQIAWIGSLQYSLVLMPAVVIGRIFDLGYFHSTFLIGSVGLVVSAFLIAECKVYWQFLLAQGILVGIAAGMCFVPLIGVIGHWFQKKRGMVLSINAFGGSIGGTVVPIVVRQLIPKVGLPWTMRILGFIMLLLLGIANLTMKTRLPPKDIAGGVFNFKAFKNPAFSVYCCTTFVTFLGLYTLFTFITSSAISGGVSPSFALYLVSIANACSGVGRLVTAIMVDKTGAVNISTPMTLIAAVATLTWPLARTEGAFIAVAAIYGFTSSAYLSTYQLSAYFLGDIEDVGRRAGMGMTFAAFGALAGPPISGAINRAIGGYSAVAHYAGTMLLLSCVLSLTTRYLVLRRLWGKF